MDGLTTNGVLVMHPRNGFTQDSKPGVWREISVCGNVFTLRETRSAQQRGKMVRRPGCVCSSRSVLIQTRSSDSHLLNLVEHDPISMATVCPSQLSGTRASKQSSGGVTSAQPISNQNIFSHTNHPL